jgi:hypothetical protein
LDVLAKVGGLEIAGLVGVTLAAASRRIPVFVDGFIASAAALIAVERRCPNLRGRAELEDKLYAALIADGDAQIQAGQLDTGVTELEQAARLSPERGEAWALLAHLATSGTLP